MNEDTKTLVDIYLEEAKRCEDAIQMHLDRARKAESFTDWIVENHYIIRESKQLDRWLRKAKGLYHYPKFIVNLM